MRNPGIGSLVMVMALVAASCSEGSDDTSAAELSTTSPQVETTVPADPVPETSDAPEPEPVAATEPAPDVTGPAPETTEPAPEAPELPEGYEGHVSEVYVDEANWVCRARPTLNQAARLGEQCRVFAPVYRQRTLTALLGQVESDESTRTIAYDNISPCTSISDTGCVVSYSSYRDTVPPPDNGIFGRTSDGPAMCVNPVDPAGGAAVSSPYFSVEGNGGALSRGTQPFDDEARTAEMTTPFVSYPDMITVDCVDDGRFGYLQLTITTEDGPRIDDIGGDLTPDWGMHLVDVNVAMGDLVDLVASQAAALS